MRDINREHARLIILRALQASPGEASNSAALQDELETYGIRQNRAWVHAEIRWLANMGAVSISEASTVLIVELRQIGLDHLERRAYLPEVRRPSLDGG
jgi:hypothetical protein